MLKSFIYLLNCLLMASILLALPASKARAEAKTVSISIETKIKPVAGLGLILSQGRTVQKPEVKIEEKKQGLLVVSFTLEKEDFDQDSLATAMLIAEDSSVAFGDLEPVFLKGFSMNLLALPECKGPKVSLTTLSSEESVLQSLVAVRSERRQIQQQSVEKELQGPLLEKLSRLEKGFGLTREEDLSATLPPLQLIDRLSRLIAAVKNHRANRARPEQPTPSAAPAEE